MRKLMVKLCEYLEKKLLYEGYCFYFRDDILGDLTLGGAYYDLDVYGYPTRFVARGQNGSYTNDKLTYSRINNRI